MNRRRRYYIYLRYIYGLEEKNSKSEVTFAVFRLPLTSCLTSLITKCIDKLRAAREKLEFFRVKS